MEGLYQDWKELDFAVDKDEELEKGKHKLLIFPGDQAEELPCQQ